jgi:hypothetical protein
MVVLFINIVYNMKREDMVKCKEWQCVLWKQRSLHTAIVQNRVNGGTWKGIRRRMGKEKSKKDQEKQKKGDGIEIERR